MKYTVEKLPGSEAVLEVDFTWEDLEKASDKAYRKLVQEVNIPGFRRGKAPRSLIERRLGKDHIYQEGLDALITDTYRKVVKESELTPIAQPELEAPAFERGQPYHVSLKIPVLTPIELGDYHSLHFQRPEVSVTSDEVEQQIESQRDQLAEWKQVERAAEYGDRVTVDLKLTVEDKTVSNLHDNPFELVEERTGIFTGMDQHIVGMQAGESKEFTTTLPEDYTNTEIAGKEAHYEVTLHKIEIKELPELDDAFAAKVSEGQYQTMEDLRKGISDSIYETQQRQANEQLQEEIVDALIEQSQIELHPLLIREEAEEMLHQLQHTLEGYRMSLDQYFMTMKQTREEYLESQLPDAERRLKRRMALEAVAEQEQLAVPRDQLEMLQQAYEQGNQRLTDTQVRFLSEALLRELALARLVELATGSAESEDTETPAEADAEEASTNNAEAAALAAQQVADSQEEAGESAAAPAGTTGESAPEAQAAPSDSAASTEVEAQ